jgi:hypothetical protein
MRLGLNDDKKRNKLIYYSSDIEDKAFFCSENDDAGKVVWNDISASSSVKLIQFPPLKSILCLRIE